MMHTHERRHPTAALLQLPDASENAGSSSDRAGQLTLQLSTESYPMKAAEASEVNTDFHNVDAAGATVPPLCDIPAASFGKRLCAAREAHGWTRSEVATRLKLPAQLIARLESDDYDGLTEGVFLRGYLGSYARLTGVPVELADQVAAIHTQCAPLVATGTVSRSRYLFARYSVSATYLVLTAIIVVPAVWLATHGGLEQNLARTTPLDPPAQIVAAAPARDASSQTLDGQNNPTEATAASGAPATVAGAPTPFDQKPVIASMAPFASAPVATAPVATANEPAPLESEIGSGSHTLNLKLNEQSWVEITAADGRKIEYGMLAAHSEHRYRSDGPVSIKLGNAQGAVVTADGAAIDLAPYQRSNVASIKVFTGSGSDANHVDQ